MGALKGVGRLTRLILRRDRIKLPLTILILGLVLIAQTGAVASTYKTEAELTAYASTSVVSAVARAFNGPVLGATQGSVAFTETFTFTTIIVALISTLLVVRHTRQNEENGRTELLAASVVGRFAPLSAALLVAVGANVVIGALTALSFLMNGLPVEGSVLAGASMAMIGIAFAAIAAMAAQLTLTARSANGLAAASIGAAYLVRAVGDVRGSVLPDGLTATSGWLSWLSPIGIGRNTRPFADDRWWVLGLLALLVAALAAVAFWLVTRRDIGAGLLAIRPGRESARRGLLSSMGLTWRLQRGLLLGWVVAVVLLGVAFGSVGKDITSIMSASDQVSEVITTLGGTQNLVDAYLAYSMMFVGVAAAAYAIQAMLRMRSEETSGHLEMIVAGSVDKERWATSYLVTVIGGAAVLLLAGGAAAGLSYGLAIGDVWTQFGEMTVALLAYLPAVMLFCSAAAAAFAFLPSWSVALSWTVFAVMYFLVQFGQLFKLPSWSLDVSPFTHTPQLPADSFTLGPLLIMTGIALAVATLSLWGFRRRNLSTS